MLFHKPAKNHSFFKEFWLLGLKGQTKTLLIISRHISKFSLLTKCRLYYFLRFHTLVLQKLTQNYLFLLCISVNMVKGQKVFYS